MPPCQRGTQQGCCPIQGAVISALGMILLILAPSSSHRHIATEGKEKFQATLDVVKSLNSLDSQGDNHIPCWKGPPIPSDLTDHPLNTPDPLLKMNWSQTKTSSIYNIDHFFKQ
jgi:hypothetical protein